MKRMHVIQTRVSETEMAIISSRYQKRKIPALIRAFLLDGEKVAVEDFRENQRNYSQEVMRAIAQANSLLRTIANQRQNLSHVDKVKMQAALLAIAVSLERIAK